MKNFRGLLLSFLFLISAMIIPQSNNADTTISLVKNFNPYPTYKYNDIWAYVDPQGREYAILGTRRGTSFIDITNPTLPVEVGFIGGPTSTWRDIKVHSHYAYITTEGTGAGTGLQIVDLSNLPASVTLVKTVTTWFTTAHNIYIDNGYAYVIGTGSGGGCHILNLADPINPVRTAYYTTSGYIHDIYVWNDTAYASAEDTYDVVDVSNKSNPVLVSKSAALPGIYAHSGWLTEDKRYFIACEEFNVRDVTVWDLQDRSSWNLIVPQWQSSGNTPVHNVFVKGNYAHISYYKDGYIILDISNPFSPQLAGRYDTYPGNTGTYEGAWGAYPYLPSGNMLISDISTGLWIFRFSLDESVVPVELTGFSANTTGNDVTLNWSTATELNNNGFEIQRSVDNNNWFTIGFKDGNGTKASNSNYSFNDKNLTVGKYFYRLVQLDFNGVKTFYDAIEVLINEELSFDISQNYPNPFNPTTIINISLAMKGNVSLRVFNPNGELVATLFEGELDRGVHNFNFDASALSSGMYFARLTGSGSAKTIKMILLK